MLVNRVDACALNLAQRSDRVLALDFMTGTGGLDGFGGYPTRYGGLPSI